MSSTVPTLPAPKSTVGARPTNSGQYLVDPFSLSRRFTTDQSNRALRHTTGGTIIFLEGRKRAAFHIVLRAGECSYEPRSKEDLILIIACQAPFWESFRLRRAPLWLTAETIGPKPASLHRLTRILKFVNCKQ